MSYNGPAPKLISEAHQREIEEQTRARMRGPFGKFEIEWKPGDPLFEAIKTAYLAGDEVSSGVIVKSLVRSEPLDSPARCLVEFAPEPLAAETLPRYAEPWTFEDVANGFERLGRAAAKFGVEIPNPPERPALRWSPSGRRVCFWCDLGRLRERTDRANYCPACGRRLRSRLRIFLAKLARGFSSIGSFVIPRAGVEPRDNH